MDHQNKECLDQLRYFSQLAPKSVYCVITNVHDVSVAIFYHIQFTQYQILFQIPASVLGVNLTDCVDTELASQRHINTCE